MTLHNEKEQNIIPAPHRRKKKCNILHGRKRVNAKHYSAQTDKYSALQRIKEKNVVNYTIKKGRKKRENGKHMILRYKERQSILTLQRQRQQNTLHCKERTSKRSKIHSKETKHSTLHWQ